jgi:circadian clock protein KaiC
MRGREFREGYHDFVIRRGGVEVYPRLVAAEHRTGYEREPIQSGLEGLDALLGGGLARGTSTLVTGPAGTGKSTLASQYAVTAAAKGEHAAIYLFDESVATLRERSAGLGLAVGPLLESARLSVQQVDPAELSPGEFAHLVRRAERTIRELRFGDQGITVGEPLREFQGIMTGSPQLVGTATDRAGQG